MPGRRCVSAARLRLRLSVSAAVSLRRKLILAENLRHCGGLLCYPGAQQVMALSEGALRQAGFPTTKAGTLQTVSRLGADGKLPLDAWAFAFPVAEIMREQLLAVRGIDPWTVTSSLAALDLERKKSDGALLAQFARRVAGLKARFVIVGADSLSVKACGGIMPLN